jgi:hypothetical protein
LPLRAMLATALRSDGELAHAGDEANVAGFAGRQVSSTADNRSREQGDDKPVSNGDPAPDAASVVEVPANRARTVAWGELMNDWQGCVARLAHVLGQDAA